MKKTVLTLLCGFGIIAPSAVATDKISAATMTNLQAAFNGESNAHARSLRLPRRPMMKATRAPRVSSGLRQEPRNFMLRIMKL
jgi:hypothetical protein